MAELPSYVRILRDGAGVQFDPGVLASEMERGLAKMRVSQSRVVVQVAATLYFRTRKDSLSFEDWYFNTIKRIGWFNWRDKRSGTVRSVRFKGGDIGNLEPLSAGFGHSKRSVTLEYLR
ncbi:hypothetical protein [Comamonas terrigena]|jgi:hypothetical protein|uniref:hypothetical protein n=1 Tax=Comamonas terrigena TaxID=32013 RepID=UPI002353E62C|nr:hypothetical protein [Comamonas terrigena]